ncbi:MAG: hypothetical protein MUE68_04120 [Bacteroidetes bacterium]|nr:hypothetical protein [Bacteroidota bacterium]
MKPAHLRSAAGLVVLLAIPALASDSLQVRPPDERQLPLFLSLSADPRLSMRSATEDLLTLHSVMTQAEDRLLGTQWFNEQSMAGTVGGIVLRFGKYAIIDVPLDYFAVVLAHEYAGHGSRYRELKMSNIHYAFDAPPPYGKGGGEASTRASGQSADELIAIWSGGVEAHPRLQQGLALRWIEQERIHYREALLYFWSFKIAYAYIQDSRPDLLDGRSDDDPRAYVRLLNAGFTPLTPATPLRVTVSDLKSAAHLNLVDPFLYMSLSVALVSYLWSGNAYGPLHMLRVGPVDLLPTLRSGWTPFGIEYHFETYLRWGGRTALVDLRAGDRTFHSGWGGFGVEVRRIFEDPDLRIDGSVMMWRQPGLKSGWAPSKVVGSGLGAGFTVRAYRALDAFSSSVRIVGEVGYKSGGFVEGFPMAASPLVAIGIAWKP